MKNLVITALLTIGSMGAFAQTSETRQSQDFTALEVKNGIQVIFTQSDDQSLKVESDDKAYLENIVTEYKGGTLKIYIREPKGNQSTVKTPKTAKVYVSQNNVSNFKAITGASIKIVNTVVMDDITIKLASGASFTGMLQCKAKCSVKAESGSSFRGNLTAADFETNVTGGATVKIIGNTGTLIVFCNNGSLQAGKLMSEKSDIKAINASTAFVNVSKSIKAYTDDSSTITYYGEPIDVNLGDNSYAIKRDNLKLALN